MKFNFLLALAIGAAISANAQGYKDGIEYYKAGQFDNAITLLNRNMSDPSTDTAVAQYYLGQSYLAKGDKSAAKKAFDAGIAANPECGYNYVGIGALQLMNNDKEGAKDSFKKAQSLAKKNAEILVDIARAYYNADPTAYDKNIAELIKKAHKTSKDREPAIYIFEGDRLAKAKDWNAAATQYEQAIYFDEDNPEGYVKYARVYTYLNPEYSIQKLTELLQRRPTSALGQRELAEKYYEEGKWTRAADLYGKYIDNPNHFPEDKARYAVLLYAGQKYPEAIAISKEVLAADPDNFQVQRIVVRSLNDLKDTKQALEKCREFINSPKNADKFNASDFTTYASLLRADSLDSDAIKVLEGALVKFPDNAGILYDISDYWFDQKDYPKSADFIEKYLQVEKEPGRSDFYSGAVRFLGATSAMREDSVKREDYGKRGIAMMKRAMDGLDLASIPPSYIRRLGLITVTKNEGKADLATFEVFSDLLKRLNMDPKYSDPSNPDNLLSYYADAYRYINQYYLIIGDSEKAAEAKAEQQKYEELANNAAK